MRLTGGRAGGFLSLTNSLAAMGELKEITHTRIGF